ncbi:protein of unknown function (DU1801) [Cyclobacterium xiamenense]|uniref:YdhG-like domain-containing protein n=1 Tax=Cyclobacterium xiamenense TaxID=1297121 RepID=A0A1H6TKN0_9BACT|nr:DUF1801 domain-containing protein [Cyclobacterium xiamenense]SEI79876.1 protein of unknown function (DU1801) [Cyclobacterium xiamenense]
MQYEAETVGHYLEQLESDWRKELLEEIRVLIKSQGSRLREGIEYKMLAYWLEDRTIFHLNAQRAYVSLYVGTITKIPDAKELLQDFDTGKGCIRIKKSVVLAKTGLPAFIKKTIDWWERGGESDC